MLQGLLHCRSWTLQTDSSNELTRGHAPVRCLGCLIRMDQLHVAPGILLNNEVEVRQGFQHDLTSNRYSGGQDHSCEAGLPSICLTASSASSCW